MKEDWSPPDWWYLDTRPSSDCGYFENMSRIIFQAGLNWRVVDKKWPAILTAFCRFSTEKVSCFTESDIERLMKDEGIIRNKGKISAIVQNAKEFEKIKNEYGSFQIYLDSLDKSENYSAVVKTLSTRFRWLGPSSANIFLYTVGEKIEHT